MPELDVSSVACHMIRIQTLLQLQRLCFVVKVDVRIRERHELQKWSYSTHYTMKNGVMIWLVDNKERSKSKPAGRERKASDQWQQSKEDISVFAKVSIAAGSCEGFSEGKRGKFTCLLVGVFLRSSLCRFDLTQEAPWCRGASRNSRRRGAGRPTQ